MWSQRPPEIYRTPKDPKHLGGYNWSALLFGLLLLLGANVAATQFIAWRFQYQAALGAPILRTNTFAVYQPFAWGFWVWKHGSSPQPEIRLPILGGALIVVGASTVALVLVYALNIRRTRKLSLNAEDIHGSAKWASSEDVRATGLLANPQGVYVGGYFDERAKRLYYLRHNGPEHVLAFAPTRSGKGVGLVIPTLLAWSESAVIYDIKGENWAKTAGYRAKSGHLCFKFSPVEKANGSRFNPLAEVRIGTPRDVSDAQNVADMIVRTGEDSPQERYWQDAAASITTGMILHVCYAAAAEKRVACLADLARVFTTPGQGFRDTLNGIASYIHDPMRQYHWKTGSGLGSQTHPVVGEKVQEMLDKEDKDFSGVLSTAKTALTLYSDPLVSKNTSASDFTIRDLVNHEKPVSLYLVVPPSDKIRLRPLIRLIFTMIVNRLTEKMDFEGADQKRNNHRLLFMIDEFPSLALFFPHLAAQPASRALTTAEFAAVAKSCAPDAPVSTLRAIAKVESAFNPLAISINYPDKAPERLGLDEGTVALSRQPTTLSEAVRWTKWLYSRGLTVSVGLMQVNAEHLAGLGLSLEQAFDPCANLRAGWTILNTKYRTAAAVLGQGQLALHAAISSYNSGSLIAGFNNGYVDKVIQNKPEVSSIPALAGQLNRPEVSSVPRSVDPPSVPPVSETEVEDPNAATTRVSWKRNKN